MWCWYFERLWPRMPTSSWMYTLPLAVIARPSSHADRPAQRLTPAGGDEPALLGPQATGPAEQTRLAYGRVTVEQEPLARRRTMERDIEVEARGVERVLLVGVRA